MLPTGDAPSWIQAAGVVVALVFSGYQLGVQRKEGADSARRHQQAERDAAARHKQEILRLEEASRDAAERHRQEMADRKRERLVSNYTAWMKSACELVAATLQGRLARQRIVELESLPQTFGGNEEEKEEHAKYVALLMRVAEAGLRNAAASIAIRADEDPPGVTLVEAIDASLREALSNEATAPEVCWQAAQNCGDLARQRLCTTKA